MMKAKFTIGLFFLFCLNASGQILNYFKDIASPQAALVDRYGNYPVDFSTGLVDISIPLYTIKTTSLTIPLQLKFHASGLRADEREGLVGIRWALFGLGQVTREIKGYPDEYYPFNSKVNYPDSIPNFYDLYGTTSTMYKGGTYNEYFESGFTDPFDLSIYYRPGAYKDTEYDIFSYTLPSGKSGKFIVPGNNGVGVPMPFEPIKIYVNEVAGSRSKIQRITIFDDNGDVYSFGENSYIDNNDDSWPTTWYLSNVVSANKQDTIQMTYTKPQLNNYYSTENYVTNDRLHDNSNFYMYLDDPDFSATPLYMMIGQLLTSDYYKLNYSVNSLANNTPWSISSIRFNQGGNIGTVNFNYQNDTYGNPTYLYQMVVTNSQNNPVKTIEFDLKNNASGHIKLLDKVQLTDNENVSHYTYSFDYYDSNSVPACGALSQNSDWWGYYSAAGGMLLDQTVNVVSPYTGSNIPCYISSGTGTNSGTGTKNPDVNSMKIGMLKTITYPTGGMTGFNYVQNSGASGLRIDSITNTSVSGGKEMKHYQYADYQVPGYLNAPYQSNLYSETEVECYVNTNNGNGVGYGNYVQGTYQGTFPSRYTDFQSNTVYYGDVTENIINASGKLNGKTEYIYNINPLSESYFDDLDGNEFEGDYTGYQQGYVSPYDFWKITELATKTIYKGDGTQPVKKYSYLYTPYRKYSIFDMPVFRYKTQRVNTGTPNLDNGEMELLMIYPSLDYPFSLKETFALKHQEYSIGADKLSQETETTYYDNGTTSTVVKKHAYDPNYLFPIADTLINSNGDVIVTTKQYPFNVNNGNPVYSNMISKNILNDVVQVNNYKNKQFVESTTLNYQLFYNNYLPESIVRTDNTGASDPLVDQMQFDSNGNPQYMLKNGSTKIVYLWSYNNQNRIAKIEGLTYDQVVGAVGSDLINSLAAAASPTRDQIEQIRTQINSSGLTAMVTTYSYVPLIGMVTATDHKGVTTTYTYDNFNRLQDIINDDSNVLNDYKYHFSTQQ
jgi:hypothetical protein